MDLGMNDEYFGKMLPYILNEYVTDIEWDGYCMKIEDLRYGEKIVDTILDEEFCEVFARRVADRVNKNYNASIPKLEAETNTLRITILHPSVTMNKTNINLRKIEAKVRMDCESIIEKKYCSVEVLKILEALFRCRCSGIVCGGTGTGKTELLKFGARWIPTLDTIVTLEDTNELKLKQIYPDKFVRSCIVNRHFHYSDGIEYALRANAKWLLMAEARAQEVLQVLEAASTSCAIVTCIHSKDVTQIPDRIDNMIGAGSQGVISKENDVYTFFDYGLKIEKISIENLPPYRYIDQLCIYERIGKENKIHMIVDHGQLTGSPFPLSLLEKFHTYNIDDPLKKEGDTYV